MSFVELFLLAVGLSMDAFAVSICKGLAAQRADAARMLCAGCWFGGFQALMPFLGWILGSRCKVYIERFDHWIAFVLLVVIGINMIREAVFSHDDEEANASFSPRTMLPLAIATSIDALAVGITFGLLLDSTAKIIAASLFICCITFGFSAAGVWLGSTVGGRYKTKAEVAGGCILILIGIKILLGHLGIMF